MTDRHGFERGGDLYENAPCGYIIARPDQKIVAVNAALAALVGYEPDALVDRPFTELLSVGGRIHYETVFAPLLRMRGRIGGIAADLVDAGGARVPVFLSANVKTDDAGEPMFVRIVVVDARDRRSYERELLEAREHADRERLRAQALSTTLQRSLLPPDVSAPAGMDACAYYHAASPEEIGGDFYDLFPLSRDEWGFFLGDVCGKGVGAATVTSLTRYALRAAAVIDRDPTAALHNVDAVLKQDAPDQFPRFSTVIFGILRRDGDGADVHLASGGHPPPLLLATDGHVRYVDTLGGMPVGVVAEPRFGSTRIRLNAGDTLVLYTDGLTEARTGVGAQRFDHDDGLLAFAAAHCPTSAAGIVDAITSLIADLGAGVQDDVAVLALGARN